METLRVLFVDDSPTMRRIIQNSLQKIGYTDMIQSENGEDALEKLENNPIDLIITDWNMPVMNGEQLVINIRREEKYSSIPILMVTTRGMKEDVLTAVRIGVNGYVVKPFTPDILKKKISDMMSKFIKV